MGKTSGEKITDADSYFTILKSTTENNDWAVRYYELHGSDLRQSQILFVNSLRMNELLLDGIQVLGRPPKKLRIQLFYRSDSEFSVLQNENNVALGSSEYPASEQPGSLAMLNLEDSGGQLFATDPKVPDLHQAANCRPRL